MKNYTITVNGKAYAVTVEEGAVSGIAAAPAAPVAAPAAQRPPRRHRLRPQHRQAQQALSAYPHPCLAR